MLLERKLDPFDLRGLAVVPSVNLPNRQHLACSFWSARSNMLYWGCRNTGFGLQQVSLLSQAEKGNLKKHLHVEPKKTVLE